MLGRAWTILQRELPLGFRASRSCAAPRGNRGLRTAEALSAARRGGPRLGDPAGGTTASGSTRSLRSCSVSPERGLISGSSRTSGKPASRLAAHGAGETSVAYLREAFERLPGGLDPS